MLAQKDQCYHHNFHQQLFFHHNVVSFSLSLPSRFPPKEFLPKWCNLCVLSETKSQFYTPLYPHEPFSFRLLQPSKEA